jgi:hypothetical protein
VALSSSCTSDPFTNDGQACPVAQVNAPFATFTTAGQPQRLFSQAVIGGPNGALLGHRLAKGRYQILLRSLDSHRNVLGTTNPVTLTIRH